MFLDYLINNKFYLKEKIRIECAEVKEDNGTLSISGEHEWIEIEGIMYIHSIDRHEILFYKDNRNYVYWCDVIKFTEFYCKTKSEVREQNITEILK